MNNSQDNNGENKFLVRRLDKLGRALPPKEYWNILGKKPGDTNFKVEIWFDGDAFNIKPYTGEDSKVIGIVRKVDTLGRVVIPNDYLKLLDVCTQKEDVFLEYSLNNKTIVAKLFYPQNICVICHNMKDNGSIVKGRRICNDCISEIKTLA